MTHYATLGVDKTATSHDIKKAYKSLASKHHPDKGGDTGKFQEINTAYQILSDDVKRAQYDQELAHPGGHGGFRFNNNSGMDDDDIADLLRRQFGFAFGAGGGDPFSQFKQAHSHTKQEPRNRDVRIGLHLDLIDNLTEQTKTLNITLPGNMQENVEIKIPRGVHSGSTIRYPGLGDHSVAGAPRADLYVQFQLRNHDKFEQYGVDLVTPLTLNCLEAIVGCEKEVTGVDGTVFKLTIPPGTQYGAKFGIPEQGLYHTDRPGRGRLIVVANIYVPKELTESQAAAIKSIIATNS